MKYIGIIISIGLLVFILINKQNENTINTELEKENLELKSKLSECLDKKDDNQDSFNLKVYNEVKIGNQVWKNKNLDVDRFRNGDLIIQANTCEEWNKAWINRQPAWCYYNFDSDNSKYGKLYNRFAVNDPRGLAPNGFHIPSIDEWKILIDFLGGIDNAYIKLKSKNKWSKDNSGTNESGFSAMPLGEIVNCDGLAHCIFGDEDNTSWWSSTITDAFSTPNGYNVIQTLDIHCNTAPNKCVAGDWDGKPVRCIKD